MSRIIASGFVASVGATCAIGLAQENRPTARDPRAVEIIKKADTAAKKCTLVTYEARTTGEGWVTSLYGSVSGNAVIEGWQDDAIERFRFNIDVLPAGETKTIKLSVGRDGRQYYLINHDAKTVETGPDVSVFGNYVRSSRLIAMREFVHPTPFADELKAVALTLKDETTDIDGQPCHIVVVQYSESSSQATWYFSTKDSLPRRVDRRIPNPSGGKPATVSLRIERLIVNPSFVADPFALRIPSGYTHRELPKH